MHDFKLWNVVKWICELGFNHMIMTGWVWLIISIMCYVFGVH